MNLLQLLLGMMLTNNTVNSVSQQTGSSSKLTSKLLMLAIPLLLRYLTQNASSQSGAQSLLGALLQHNSQRSMSSQVDEVDMEDGKKIIGHILGKDQDKVVDSLAQETGMDSSAVLQTLEAIAPGLLSGLSAATTANAKQDDLSGLLNTFGGQKPQQASQPSLGLLGSLFGKKPEPEPQQSAYDGSELLSVLSALMK